MSTVEAAAKPPSASAEPPKPKKPPKKRKRKRRRWGPLARGMLTICRDFGPWTSTHALPHILAADNMFLVIVWTVVFLAMLSLAIWQFYVVVKKYLSWPIQMDARSVLDLQLFPSVTFCSPNPWKVDAASATALGSLINAYKSGAASTQWGFDSPFTMRETLRAAHWTRFMFEELRAADDNGTAGLSYGLDELVLDCTFNNKPCDLSGNTSMFSQFYDPYNGLCHTFNPNQTLNATRGGPYYGLRLVLRSVTDQFLPWVSTGGIAFRVHLANSTPFIDTYGSIVPNSRETFVATKFYLRTKLSKPYNDCYEKGTILNYYGGNYQVEACVRSCLQNNIIKLCGCYDPEFERAPNTSATSCWAVSDTNGALDCVESILSSVVEGNVSTTSFSILNNCTECRYPCNMTYYQLSPSYALWPAKNYIPPVCYNTSDNGFTSTSSCKSWYAANTSVLHVFFGRITFESDVESGAYDVISMIADTGGQIGLWLGMSGVSVFEFFVLFAVLLMYCIMRPKEVSLQGFDYFKQFDKEIKENLADDDPDLIYGDSDEEKVPPAIHEPNETKRVTDLGPTKEEPPETVLEEAPPPPEEEAKPPETAEPAAESAEPVADKPKTGEGNTAKEKQD